MKHSHLSERHHPSLDTVGIASWRQSVNGVNSIPISPHWHNHVEILRINKGAIRITVGEETYCADAGTVIFINPRQIHSGISLSEQLQYDVVQINLESLTSKSAASREFLDPLIQEKVRFSVKPSAPAAVKTVNELIRCLSSGVHPLWITGQVFQMLGILCELCTIEQGVYHISNDKFRQVLEYIDSHYTESISAHSLSQQINYNESYFCRLFKQTTGLTLSAYIRILRMERAQQLLRQPELSIAQVALQCGYTDANYFSLCVQKHFQTSPSELRQKMLNS